MRSDLVRHWALAATALLGSVQPGAYAQPPVAVWLTNADGSVQLQRQADLHWTALPAQPETGSEPAILVDSTARYQTMAGFGHTLTGGTAQLLMRMSPAARHALLQELFGNGAGDIHLSYLRVTVGASDMNDHVYTYDDRPAGETDPELTHFSLREDEADVIPVLREILRIQPRLQILATPWTAPTWMKTNHAFKAGELLPEYYPAYARYWVLYLQGMAAHGIPIAALTPQNEPENANNTPSMLMTAQQEAQFIGQDLGPALQRSGLHTRVVLFDHNCDHPIYPETILADPAAARYTDGSGFHLYLGKISALTEVHNSHPDKHIYFTEQMVIPGRHGTDPSIAEPVARLIVGAPANWSENVLLWNLAADAHNGPHTSDGGCPICAGALTLEGDHVKRLTAYYTIAHASKFVPPGSVRIGAESPAGSLPHIAFQTPDRHTVVIVSNPGTDARPVLLQFHGQEVRGELAAGAVATYVW